jgi:uncharacterized protein YbaR (Trm112 family)
MTDDDFLNVLRCPMDPSRAARLEQAHDGLLCQRCGVKYPSKEGIPSLMIDEAVLPPGCSRAADLPCRRTPAEAPA